MNRMWQDILISSGQWIFAASMIPSLLSKDKPHRITSLLTSIILFSFSFSFYTLKLYQGCFSSLVVASLWMVLFIQKQNRKT